MHDAQIRDPDAIFRYVMGGRSTLTLVSRISGQRFTFLVESKILRPVDGESEDQFAARKRDAIMGVRFVRVLTGPDNTRDYTYIGHINAARQFSTDRGTKISPDSPSVRAWAWFWSVLMHRLPKLEQLEVWHNGRCSRCGRALTVPESVAFGLGPICAQEVGSVFPTGPSVALPPLVAPRATRPATFKPRAPLSFRPSQPVEINR